jgi:hypothetical protein
MGRSKFNTNTRHWLLAIATRASADRGEIRGVSDEPEPETGTETPAAGGVFGNLPGSRPGTRSPRRGSAGAAKGDGTKRAAATKPKPRAEPSQKPRPAPEAAPGDSRPAAADEPGGGLEDIAWAGVAAAAEAATLGVRLASRAIEALRGNSERS